MKHKFSGWRGGDALCSKSICVSLFNKTWEVLSRRLVTDRTIRLAANESEVGDVISLAWLVCAFENGLGKDVVELKLMMRAGMIVRDNKMRAPILRTVGAKREEHSFEKGATLVTSFQFFRYNIETSDLLSQSLD
jgi:hypothetical protein